MSLGRISWETTLQWPTAHAEIRAGRRSKLRPQEKGREIPRIQFLRIVLPSILSISKIRDQELAV